MPGHVRFVVDTNLFHEFKLLNSPDIDWGLLGDFDEIELTVCDVVQSELDQQKKDNRSRVKKRAIEAVRWFRGMLLAGASEHVFRETGPRVVMTLTPTAASRDHSGVLDPSVDDDRIVGVAVALRQADASADIRLLTDDTRPAAKAKTLGIPFQFIPTPWAREPELDDQARETETLRSQLAAIKATHPKLGVSADGAVNHRVTVDRAAWAAVTSDERATARTVVAEQFPLSALEERFAADAIRRRPSPWQLGRGQVTTVPVPPGALAKYRDVTYPAWLDACVNAAETLPDAFNSAIAGAPITVRLTNNGTRPAENVRIRFRARGGFRIAPEGVEVAPDLPSLPKAPAPPEESYVSADGNPIGRVTAIHPLQSPFDSLMPLTRFPTPHEEEDWYYEPGRPTEPTDVYDLVCARFRHGGEEETFTLLVYPSQQQDMVAASLEVEINASNLPEPVKQVFPIEIATRFLPSGPAIEAFIRDEDPIGRALKSP